MLVSKNIKRLLDFCVFLLIIYVTFHTIYKHCMLERVLISGCKKIATQDIKNALGIRYGSKILLSDKDAIAMRLKDNIPWIKSIDVKILLPYEVRIYVEERKPAGYSYVDKQWWTFDTDGILIVPVQELPSDVDMLFAGKEASIKAIEFVRQMKKYAPRLRCKIAQRIGTRRWNIKTSDNISVMLSEHDIEDNLIWLQKLYDFYDIKSLCIECIDLRNKKPLCRIANNSIPSKVQ